MQAKLAPDDSRSPGEGDSNAPSSYPGSRLSWPSPRSTDHSLPRPAPPAPMSPPTAGRTGPVTRTCPRASARSLCLPGAGRCAYPAQGAVLTRRRALCLPGAGRCADHAPALEPVPVQVSHQGDRVPGLLRERRYRLASRGGLDHEGTRRPADVYQGLPALDGDALDLVAEVPAGD